MNLDHSEIGKQRLYRGLPYDILKVHVGLYTLEPRFEILYASGDINNISLPVLKGDPPCN